jgi:predicted dehydrogenase
MNWQLPREVTSRIFLQSSSRSPLEFSAELIFDGGVSVGLYCSFLTARQQWVHISGEKGWLRVPGFVRPLDSYEPAFEVNSVEIRAVSDVKCPPGVDPVTQGHATSQEARMWRNFANQVFTGKLNADWPLWAVMTQKVSDACLEAAKLGSPVKLVSRL